MNRFKEGIDLYVQSNFEYSTHESLVKDGIYKEIIRYFDLDDVDPIQTHFVLSRIGTAMCQSLSSGRKQVLGDSTKFGRGKKKKPQWINVRRKK